MLDRVGEPDQSAARHDPTAGSPEPHEPVSHEPVSIDLAPGRPVPRESMLRACLATLVRLVALAIATPISLLPARWRDRVPGRHSLPLVSGTAVSVLLEGGLGLWLIIHVYRGALGQGVLASLVDYSGIFMLTGIYLCLEAGGRFASALALGEALGTLPLWLTERTVSWLWAGHRADRAARERICDAPLPRARLLRRR